MIINAIKSAAPKSFAALSLFVVLAASAAAARAQAPDAITFRVPFEFTAGEVRLPAGEYTVRRASRAGQAYFIRSRDGRSAAVVPVVSAIAAGPRDARLPRLSFNAYGGQYYLSQLRPGGDVEGAEFRRSRAEREVSRSGAERRRVDVAALNR